MHPLSQLNRTELVSLLNEKGISVSRSLPKERLIEILSGSPPKPGEEDPMGVYRAAVLRTIQENWASLQLQLLKGCEIHCLTKGKPCPDIMLLTCYLRLQKFTQ